MLIKGFQKTTLLDYPGKVAATVFTGGCNFRCPFCHNAGLVLELQQTETIPDDTVLSYLKKRRGILDGVCVTGGEPLLQPDLIQFLESLREMGYAIKLDTNGSMPERLQALIDRKLIDYVAMDIKNASEQYAKTCGVSDAPEGIDQSIDLLLQGVIDYEFRTTVVREFHSAKEIEQMAKRIEGAKKYFLQGFIDSGHLIGVGYSGYSPEEMLALLPFAQKYVPNATLRGVEAPKGN